jgi:siroheme synthase
LPLLPRNSGFSGAADREKIRERPCHSHSIVSGISKYLAMLAFSQAHAELTVRSTAKTFRLITIDGDRSRKDLGALAACRARPWNVSRSLV